MPLWGKRDKVCLPLVGQDIPPPPTASSSGEERAGCSCTTVL